MQEYRGGPGSVGPSVSARQSDLRCRNILYITGYAWLSEKESGSEGSQLAGECTFPQS